MSAALQALASAKAAGIRLRVTSDGRVRVDAGGASPEVVAVLRRHRDEVAIIMAQRSAGAVPYQPDLDHDAAEAAAMSEHYATLAGPVLPERDPMAEGLLRGFWAHRGAQPD